MTGLARVLAKSAGVPPSAVSLLQGAAGRLKTFRIAGDPAKLAAALERAILGEAGDEANMTATVLDGKALAAEVRGKVAEEAKRIGAKLGRKPGLAVVLVGENPASEVYVRNKARSTLEAGMESFEHKLPETTSQADLLALVEKLNADDPRSTAFSCNCRCRSRSIRRAC
jgi:hypothetical protein